MASTHSPTCRSRELPSFTVGRSFASILSTATSVCGSAPSTLARNSRRSVSLTVTSSAFLTTWALVSTTPSGLTMKPEPWPRTGTSRGTCMPCGMPKRRKNSWNGSAAPSSSSPPWASAVRCVPLTLMLTTAGPFCAVICAKPGSASPPGCANGTATGCATACAWRLVTRPAPVAPSAPAATNARMNLRGVDARVFMVCLSLCQVMRWQAVCAATLKKDLDPITIKKIAASAFHASAGNRFDLCETPQGSVLKKRLRAQAAPGAPWSAPCPGWRSCGRRTRPRSRG